MEEKDNKPQNTTKGIFNKERIKKNFTIPKIILGIIGIVAVIAIMVFLNKDDKVNKDNSISNTGLSKKEYSVKESETKQIQLVDYDGGNFTMKIPEGWTVETGGADMFYAIRVYNPTDTRYQIFAILKAEPFLKNDNAKNWYQSYYNSYGGSGNKILAEAIVLHSPTVEAFYSNFNEYTAYTKRVDTIYSTFNFPDLKNFAVVESFEANSSMKGVAKDDKTLRATFQDSKTGKNGEGLFMGSLIGQGSYMLLGYDTMFYTMYNIMGITAGESDLVNYQEILTKSLSSLVYKDSFANQTIANGQERTKNALAINASIQEAYDSYNSAWTARQKTYDILSQKNSDATLSYERVYDTETGEIYKAYNGFTDDYKGERYKSVTDQMYTEPINGYIEKP